MLELHHPVKPESHAGVNEDRCQPRVIAEDIVCCAADDHAAPLFPQPPDRLVLRLINLLAEGIPHVVHGRIDIHHDGVKQTVRRLFIVVLQNLLADIALLRDRLQQLLVVKLQPELCRDASSDLMSA